MDLQGGVEVTLGLWNWIKRVKIHNMKNINIWNFRWQKSFMEKLCRKITSHILVCLSICLCAHSIAHKIHYNTGWTRSNTGSLKLNRKSNNWQYEKKSLWNFRWQESILEKWCRKITSHLLVCLSICLCACAFLCLFVNKMHFQTPVSFLCATFRPCKYFQHFIWKKYFLALQTDQKYSK